MFFFKNNLKEFRCPACGKLLMKYKFKGSLLIIQAKCPRCGNIATLEKERVTGQDDNNN